MLTWILSILIAFGFAFPLLPPDAISAPVRSPPAVEKYTANDNTFALYKPRGWKVDSRVLYKGQNPRYKETMTPLDISREVYESVYGK